MADEENYPGEYITAVNTVHHSKEYPSFVELPVVSKGDLPELHNLRAEFEMSYPSLDYDYVVSRGEDFLNNIVNVQVEKSA